MSEQAIVMKRGKAKIGYITDNVFTPESDHDGEIPSSYISLHDFLILTNPNQKVKDTEEVRKAIGYTKIWIYVENNDDWWAYFNHKCNQCKKKCKQSHMVEVMVCPQFEPID